MKTWQEFLEDKGENVNEVLEPLKRFAKKLVGYPSEPEQQPTQASPPAIRSPINTIASLARHVPNAKETLTKFVQQIEAASREGLGQKEAIKHAITPDIENAIKEIETAIGGRMIPPDVGSQLAQQRFGAGSGQYIAWVFNNWSKAQSELGLSAQGELKQQGEVPSGTSTLPQVPGHYTTKGGTTGSYGGAGSEQWQSRRR